MIYFITENSARMTTIINKMTTIRERISFFSQAKLTRLTINVSLDDDLYTFNMFMCDAKESTTKYTVKMESEMMSLSTHST